MLLTFSPENPVKVVSGNTIGQCLDWKKEKYEQSLQCKLFYVKTYGQFIHSLEKDLGQVESMYLLLVKSGKSERLIGTLSL